MIKNKQQSKEFLLQNNLNTIITSSTFNNVNDNLYEIVIFLLNNRLNYYSIRENKPSGLFIYGIEYSDVLNTVIKNYKNKQFTICESMFLYDKDNMLIQGDFLLTKDFILSYGYSNIKNQSLREASQNFQYKNANIDLKQRHYVNSQVNKIIDYIVDNNLFDMVVELTLYDCNVGIKKENIIVWEVRNY